MFVGYGGRVAAFLACVPVTRHQVPSHQLGHGPCRTARPSTTIMWRLTGFCSFPFSSSTLMWCTWQPHSHLNQAMAGRNDKADKVLTCTPPSSLSSKVCVCEEWGGLQGAHSCPTFLPYLQGRGVRQRKDGQDSTHPIPSSLISTLRGWGRGRLATQPPLLHFHSQMTQAHQVFMNKGTCHYQSSQCTERWRSL